MSFTRHVLELIVEGLLSDGREVTCQSNHVTVSHQAGVLLGAARSAEPVRERERPRRTYRLFLAQAATLIVKGQFYLPTRLPQPMGVR